MLGVLIGHAAERELGGILAVAGITLNGPHSWDPQIRDSRVFRRVLLHGSLGAGESYMDGWWEVRDLVGMFDRLMRSGQIDKFSQLWQVFWRWRKRLMNLQSIARARIVAEQHYDLSNEFYRLWLDPTMAYTCGYWQHGVKNLHASQIAKYDLLCRKLGLKPGMRVLDIGCGWGGLARYMAKQHGVHVTGVTISKEQLAFAQEYCRGTSVSFLFSDYRLLSGQYDRIVSVGMLEHVGSKNYRPYMQAVSRLLKPGGLFVLHHIASPSEHSVVDPFFDWYIFPNSELPSRACLQRASEDVLVELDFHEFDFRDYALTLRAWYDQFVAAWPRIEMLGPQFDKRFYRMWEFYLLSMESAFANGRNRLWQHVYCHEGSASGFRGVYWAR
ncbi:MAG: Cfa2: cyclopropane-fatty-acyl-phospholipid synthase [Candidatus Parcubacteria bacterium]